MSQVRNETRIKSNKHIRVIRSNSKIQISRELKTNHNQTVAIIDKQNI